jgi:uncharacterized protein (DUF302 family)
MKRWFARARIAWPFMLCGAAVAGTLAYAQLARRDTSAPRTPLRVDVASRKTFDEVRAALEALASSPGFAIFGQPGATGPDPAEGARRLDALADKDGLIILAESDVGPRQSRLIGKPVRAKTYMIGNPLIAARMIALDPAAALYVPLRVLVYEDARGVAHIAYDRPSGLLDALGNETVSEVARTLDRKIHELAATAAGEAPAPIASTPGGRIMSQTRFSVEHVRHTSDRPFGEVAAAFEHQLGRFDPEVYRSLDAGGDPAATRAKLESMVGPSGFMLFTTHNHGALLRLVGRPRKAVQYIVGNPLFAIEMTQHALGASLYAPLRVLLYETEDGKTCIEYDRPSSLFGQFGDDRVDRMAASLDQKLAALAETATR